MAKPSKVNILNRPVFSSSINLWTAVALALGKTRRTPLMCSLAELKCTIAVSNVPDRLAKAR